MKGTYRFYLDGELVHEEHNALSVAGRSIVIKSLLGIIPNFANSIAYGIGDSENTPSSFGSLISDASLNFETGRANVIGSSLLIENNNDVIVYSATINDPFQSEIREVGLFPSPVVDGTVGLDGSLIFNFNNINNFIQYGTASASQLISTNNARVGGDMLSLPETDGVDNYLKYTSVFDMFEFIGRYTSQDSFRLAGLDLNESSASLVVRFETDSSNYYDLIYDTPTASGYFILEKMMTDLDIVGGPSWDNINSVKIWQNGSSEMLLDGLRIDIGDYLVDKNYGLISRAALAEPIRKPPSIPLTIEYAFSLGFNIGVNESWPT